VAAAVSAGVKGQLPKRSAAIAATISSVNVALSLAARRKRR